MIYQGTRNTIQNTSDPRLQHPDWVVSNETYYTVFEGSVYAVYVDDIPWTNSKQHRTSITRFDKQNKDWIRVWDLHPSEGIVDIVADLETFLVINMIL